MSTRRRRSASATKGGAPTKQERMEHPPSGKLPKAGSSKSTRRRRC